MDNLIDVPLLKIANDLGNPIFANVVAVGGGSRTFWY